MGNARKKRMSLFSPLISVNNPASIARRTVSKCKSNVFTKAHSSSDTGCLLKSTSVSKMRDSWDRSESLVQMEVDCSLTASMFVICRALSSLRIACAVKTSPPTMPRVWAKSSQLPANQFDTSIARHYTAYRASRANALDFVGNVRPGVHKEIARYADNALVRPATGRGRQFWLGGVRNVYTDHGKVAICQFPDIRAVAKGNRLPAVSVRVGTDPAAKFDWHAHMAQQSAKSAKNARTKYQL